MDDLIDLIVGVDGILQQQARADVEYFASIAGRPFSSAERQALDVDVLRAHPASDPADRGGLSAGHVDRSTSG